MHELSYAIQLVSSLEDYAEANNLTLISSVSVTIGEATGVIPSYLVECWPVAIEDSSLLNKAELKTEYLLSQGCCHNCKKEFAITENNGKCPNCGNEDYEIIQGNEFEITEITAK